MYRLRKPHYANNISMALYRLLLEWKTRRESQIANFYGVVEDEVRHKTRYN